MHVKISTATVWGKKRREAGEVIDVPVEVYEKNSAWMKATDDALTDPADAAKGDSVTTAADDALDAATGVEKKKK